MSDAKTISRERDIARVAEPALAQLTSYAQPLVINDRLRILGDVPRWNRYCRDTDQGQVWPTVSQSDGILIRLIREKTAMQMAVHAAASLLPTGAPLWVVGGNDEGIKSFMKNRFGMPAAFRDFQVLDIRKRCRLLQATRTEAVADIRGSVDGWKVLQTIVIDGVSQEWTSWPGLFARGRLDAATEFLLSTLQDDKHLRRSKDILDFGCGTGVISRALQQRLPQANVYALDADALAVRATKINCPTVTAILSDGFHAMPSKQRYDLIVSNPPVHLGKQEDHSIVQHFIRQSPNYLKRRGRLIFVIRRQLPVEIWLKECFASVKILAQTAQFRVWSVG